MEGRPYKLLLHGIDTLQCAYFLRQSSADVIDYQALAKQGEEIRQTKMKEPVPVELGNTSFLLSPYGTASGYPFVISNEDYKIEFGQFNNPSFFVTFKSQALWRESAYFLHEKFLKWAGSAGFVPYRNESLSRIDYSFDYNLSNIDFNEDHFVSRSSKDSVYREDGKIQTFCFGRGDIVLRVYDKVAEIQQQSDKVWFFLLWGQDTNVWRIEWQVRKPILRQFGIVTFEDLKNSLGDLLRYLSEEHTTLRIPDGDPNRSRWKLHPLWVDLQEKIGQLNRLGVCRINGKESVLEERMVRMAISVYGYLKRVAAVHCVQKRKTMVTEEEAFRLLRDRIWRVHDNLNWRIEVNKRITEIDHGEW
jgi:hypothetical protein